MSFRRWRDSRERLGKKFSDKGEALWVFRFGLQYGRCNEDAYVRKVLEDM